MITRIIATDCKIKSLDQKIGPKTLIIGPNGSGKSAHSAAAILAVDGYFPGVKKQPGAILEAFGTSATMTVGVEINGVPFKRRYKKTDTGATQDHQVDDKRKTAEEYSIALGEAGKPHIFDLAAFMSLSDEKQIGYLFDLFPPSGDVEKIGADLDTAKTKRNKLKEDIKTDKATIKRLSESRTTIELPAGTQAETTAEKDRTEAELKVARKNLNDQEIRDAAAKAKEEGKAEGKKEAKEEPPQHENLSTPLDVPVPPPSADIQGTGGAFDDLIKQLEATAERAGCETCPLLLIVKKHLRDT